jgi:hypothetical protein
MSMGKDHIINSFGNNLWETPVSSTSKQYLSIVKLTAQGLCLLLQQQALVITASLIDRNQGIKG